MDDKQAERQAGKDVAATKPGFIDKAADDELWDEALSDAGGGRFVYQRNPSDEDAAADGRTAY